MHTPEQAKELWCPMVRIARRETFTIHGAPVGGLTPVHDEHHIVAGCNTDALGGNRVPASCRCISDKCAMWRWAEKPDRRSREADNPHLLTEQYRPTLVPASWVFVPYNVARGEPAKWVEPDDAVRARRQGFCGLAGRPGVA